MLKRSQGQKNTAMKSQFVVVVCTNMLIGREREEKVCLKALNVAGHLLNE